jgi:RNA polymerase sigma-70 factor (ECF subfamily)
MPAKILEDPLPTRQSLLGRLKDWGDQESWRVFFETYWKLIYTTAVRAGLNDAETQDVVQETVIGVLNGMKNFEYQREKGSFKGWLLRLTRWRIADQFRKRQASGATASRRPAGDQTQTGELERVVDPSSGLQIEEQWDLEWELNLLEAAMARVKERVDLKHYQIYDLCVSKGWAVSKVARLLKVNVANVYLIRHRVGGQVKKELARLREKPI